MMKRPSSAVKHWGDLPSRDLQFRTFTGRGPAMLPELRTVKQAMEDDNTARRRIPHEGGSSGKKGHRPVTAEARMPHGSVGITAIQEAVHHCRLLARASLEMVARGERAYEEAVEALLEAKRNRQEWCDLVLSGENYVVHANQGFDRITCVPLLLNLTLITPLFS